MMDDDDIIIPKQFRLAEESRRRDGNFRLWCAVLVRAFDDLAEPEEFDSAMWWFSGKNTGLEEVCSVVGRSARDVRKVARKNIGLKRGER